MSRTQEENLELVKRIEADMASGTSSPDACEKEDLSQANFYKIRAILRQRGLLPKKDSRLGFNKPVVKIINAEQEPTVLGKRGPKPKHHDKCVVIVTTAGSLRNVLEGVL